MVLVSVVTDTRLPFPCRCRLLLVGHIASPRLLSQLTYAACSHEPEAVLKVDKVLAWTVGERHHAEVDVVLVSRHDIADIWVAFLQVFEQYRCGQDPETPLRVAHDVGERLEVLLEMLPEIERVSAAAPFASSSEAAQRKRLHSWAAGAEVSVAWTLKAWHGGG